MPFILFFIGIVLVVSGLKGTQSDLGNQIVKDFSGSGSFIYWIAAIGLIGTLGYIPGLEKFSRTFIALIVVALLIGNGNNGLVQKFTDALRSSGASSPISVSSSVPGFGSGGAGGIGGTGISTSDIAGLALGLGL